MEKTTNHLYGGVAQLGEHLPCKQGVKGSNPFISTKKSKIKPCVWFVIFTSMGFEVGAVVNNSPVDC